jgi:hypothetical protein
MILLLGKPKVLNTISSKDDSQILMHSGFIQHVHELNSKKSTSLLHHLLLGVNISHGTKLELISSLPMPINPSNTNVHSNFHVLALDNSSSKDSK